LFSNKLKLKGLKLEVMRNKGPSLYKEERIKKKDKEKEMVIEATPRLLFNHMPS